MSDTPSTDDAPTLTFKVVCAEGNGLYPAVLAHLEPHGLALDATLVGATSEFVQQVRERAESQGLVSNMPDSNRSESEKLKCAFHADPSSLDESLASILKTKDNFFAWPGSRVIIAIDRSTEKRCFCGSEVADDLFVDHENWLTDNVMSISDSKHCPASESEGAATGESTGPDVPSDGAAE